MRNTTRGTDNERDGMRKVGWFAKMFRSSRDDSQALEGLTSQELSIIAPNSVIEQIPNKTNVTDYWLEIGDNTGGAKFMRTFFMNWRGRTTWYGVLNPLLVNDLEGEVDLTISIEPVESDSTIMKIAYRMAVLSAEMQTVVNPAKYGDLMQEYNDLAAQMNRLRVNVEKLFRVSSAVNIGADSPDRMRRVARMLQKRFSSIGAFFVSTDTRQLDAFRHSIGVGSRSRFDKTYQEFESSNVADLFPFGYGGISHRTGVLLGLDGYNRPVFYDGWHPNLANHNGLIFGRAGAGKSFAIKVITRRAVLSGIRTAILDPDGEFELLVRDMGGPYIKLSGTGSEGGHRINLYDVEEEENEQGRTIVNLEEAIKAIQAILFKMIRIFAPELLTGQVKVAIMDSIRHLYQKWGITSDPKSLYEESANGLRKKTPPTLHDHYLLMMEDPKLQDILDFIKVFTREGGDPSKAIFDGQSTFSVSSCEIFGISLANLDEEIMRPLGSFVSQKFIWEKFFKKNRHIRKRGIMDEAQLAMEHDEEASWMENAYRRVRKLNGSMWLLTQGFEVLMRVQQGMGILKNSPTKLLLRQESLDIDAVAGKFNLSEGEANFLLTSPEGVGILKVDEESTILQIQATPQERILYSTKPSEIFEAGGR